MLDEMKALIRSKDVCVLATVSGGEPHCSLMSYVIDDDCQEFFMMTHRNTKKFHNLLQNEFVSLLIDTREEDVGEKRADVRALTINGIFRKIENPEKEALYREKLLARHPHLKGFAASGDTLVFCVRALTLQLLKGVSQAYFEKIA
ncbi:MAG: pyridoxamine 5'-phosphate oxidase family protein [Syntrophaceae bacterium]|nr:pyridoxamine 5'-phosphate oxidase family protein [Syntrophaceae bacterium]